MLDLVDLAGQSVEAMPVALSCVLVARCDTVRALTASVHWPAAVSVCGRPGRHGCRRVGEVQEGVEEAQTVPLARRLENQTQTVGALTTGLK